MKSYSKMLNYLVVICLLLNSSCATGLLKVKHLENYDYSLLQDVSYTQSDINRTIDKIRTLREQIQRYSDKLTEKDYDDIIKELTPIIEEYKKYSSIVNVVNKDHCTIVVQPKTKLTLKLNTYCLSSNKVAPSDDEPYILTNKVPDIPLYCEIMRYTNTKEDVDQHLKQSVIWNLQNRVKFEDLPSEQQELLLKVDKSAYLKVNSHFKDVSKKLLKKLIHKYSPPEVGRVKEVIKGKVYDYQGYAKRIENLRSKYQKPNNDKPIRAEGYEIYALVKANGYSSATVTFVNTTTNQIEINPNSYFEPIRKDIQSLGFDLPSSDTDYEKLRNEFVELTSIILEKIGYLGTGDAKSLRDNPDKLVIILKGLESAVTAYIRTKKEFGHCDDDDISNAFRHAYWNALMVRKLKKDFAEYISSNHELNPGNQDSREMDLWNNKIGRDIATELISKGISDNESFVNEILKNKDRLKVLK